MEMQQAGTPLFVYIEIVGTVVGVVLIGLFVRVVRELGGAVGSAIWFLIAGVALFTLAFGISAVVDGLGLTAMQNSMAGHMGLMVLAMIMVVVTASRFARLLK